MVIQDEPQESVKGRARIHEVKEAASQGALSARLREEDVNGHGERQASRGERVIGSNGVLERLV